MKGEKSNIIQIVGCGSLLCSTPNWKKKLELVLAEN
jgi:hypothetical protein